jgi:hypothetical protein
MELPMLAGKRRGKITVRLMRSPRHPFYFKEISSIGPFDLV